MLPPDITGLPEWAQSRLRWLEQREDNLRAENSALRGEVATLRGARSAEDVREMLCEASCVDVTDARCARIWSLLEHPATTMTTLAVIADERGESYAKARAELAALQSRLAAAEAEAERARGLLARCRPYVCTIPAGRVDPESGHEGDKIASAIDAHLASRPEGEVPDGR